MAKEKATGADVELASIIPPAMQTAINDTIAAMKDRGDFNPEQMLFDIFSAETLEDMLGSQVQHLNPDLIGVCLTVFEAQLADSEYEAEDENGNRQGMPVYAILRVAFDDELVPATETGSTKVVNFDKAVPAGFRGTVVTTGAMDVVAKLVRAVNKGWLPFRFTTSSRTTGAGFNVVKMEQPKR